MKTHNDKTNYHDRPGTCQSGLTTHCVDSDPVDSFILELRSKIL